jgi:hypothetical protein
MSENAEGAVKKGPNTVSLDLTVRTEIATIAGTATPQEREQVAALIAEARKGEFKVAIWSLTPAMCALLFVEHNPHNRDFRAGYAVALAEQMKKEEWQLNNATIGFYKNGELQDGQHRLGGKAKAGHSYVVPVVFGIEHKAIVTTDTGSRRSAADAAKLEGTPEAKRKRKMVRTAAAYLVKTGRKDAELKSETEVLQRIRLDQPVLDEAIRIGAAASDKTKLVAPTLDQAQCETVAYLLLTNGWAVDQVEHMLAAFQLGMSKDGQATPLFVGADIVNDSKKARTAAHHLNISKELGVVVYALQLTVQGEKAVQKKTMLARVKKGSLPDPTFPATAAGSNAA